MGKVCRHCGMESDRDKVCSWCNKSLAEPAAAKQPAGAPGPAAPPGGPPGPPGAMPAARPAARPALKPAPPTGLYAAIGVGGVLILLLAFQLVALSKATRPPAEPVNWTTLQSMTGHFTLQVPANWKSGTAGSEGTYEWVGITHGPLYEVDINGNATKGAMSDIAAAIQRASDGGGLGASRNASSRLHETLGELEKKKDKNYQEQGEEQACTFAGGEAVYSAYTCKGRVGLMSVTMKGWRMTSAGTDYGYDIRVLAPEKGFDKFEPTATKVLASVQFGRK